MKIRASGAELLRADGQTDTTELTVAFRDFSKAPKHYSLCSHNIDKSYTSSILLLHPHIFLSYLPLIFFTILHNFSILRVSVWLSLLLHRAFRRITLIINQQMHLHKISH
jgi:hypothetical protein